MNRQRKMSMIPRHCEYVVNFNPFNLQKEREHLKMINGNQPISERLCWNWDRHSWFDKFKELGGIKV